MLVFAACFDEKDQVHCNESYHEPARLLLKVHMDLK